MLVFLPTITRFPKKGVLVQSTKRVPARNKTPYLTAHPVPPLADTAALPPEVLVCVGDDTVVVDELATFPATVVVDALATFTDAEVAAALSTFPTTVVLATYPLTLVLALPAPLMRPYLLHLASF